MKKNLLTLILSLALIGLIKSQCVYTCSNYAVSQITHSNFPTGGINIVSQLFPGTDDGITGQISIGFTFNFYCTNYSNVLICSNGFIQFDIGSPPNLAYANPSQLFPDPTSPNALVALNMNDLDPGAGGTITYTTIGVSPNQQFIVTYSNVPIWYDAFNNIPSSPVYNSGQIILYETSNIIEIHSGSIGLSPYTGTQGIENETGTLGTAVSGRNDSFWSTNNTAYRWSPYLITPPTSISGNTSVCEGSTNLYQTPIITNANSYNWTFPANWLPSGTNSTSIVSPTAGLSGNVQVTATYSCGTSSPASLYVNVVPMPIVAITSATPSLICSGMPININASGAFTYTLQPSGANGTPPFLDYPMVNTTYTLSGTNSFGCISQNIATVTINVSPSPTVSINSGSICIGNSFTLVPSGASVYTLSSIFSVITPSIIGVNSYSAVGTSTNGCVSNVAVSNVTAVALPPILVSATKSVICIKETTTVTANGASTYTWNTLETNSVITVTPSSTSIYTVTGVDANGCVNTSTYTIKVISCVGLNTLSSDASSIMVFPNPNNGLFTLTSTEVSDNLFIEIYNSIGQLIHIQKIETENTQLDLKHFANGIYYIKIKASENNYQVKFVKE